MSLYAQIHARFVDADPRISRNEIRKAVSEATGVPSLQPIIEGLNPAICMGYYLSPRAGHRLAQQFGRHVIVLARDLNRCWQRFVFVKELMHVLDGSAESTDSGDKFEAVLNEINGPSPWSEQTTSEVNAFWMALGLLCPMKVHAELRRQRSRNHVGDYAIALRLQIPEVYVPRLFEPRFEDYIRRLTK